MGGGPAAVEQPGGGEQERPGADGRDPARARRGGATTAIRAPSFSASTTASPPATIRVSIGPLQSASVECICTGTPLEVATTGSTATSSIV